MHRTALFTLALPLLLYATVAAATGTDAAMPAADADAVVITSRATGEEDLMGASAGESAAATPSTPSAGKPGAPPLPDTDPFLAAIQLLESSGGAYDPGLSEHLLSLGLALQRSGRHEEAVKVFKRGAHLTRINDGLHGAGQIPLVSGEIHSRLALGQYLEADERQQYLYRIQVRSMGSGTSRATALMQQASWQYSAYRLGLGDAAYPRLMNMWDLYRLALNDIVVGEGETSPALLPPLYGMLQAQYLIADYQGDTPTAGFSTDGSLEGRQDLSRFYAYRNQSYKKGQAVIQAIHDIEREQHGADGVEVIEATVMLGDWHQWHGERDEASKVYGGAFAELLRLEDAQIETARIFGDPVPLPDLEGLLPLPPAVTAAEGHILLEFGVSGRGRVVDLERLDENDSIDGTASRLMRKLRHTTFRPRFEAGEPVATEKIVRAYEATQ